MSWPAIARRGIGSADARAGARPRAAPSRLALAGAEGHVQRRPMRHRPAGRGDRPLKDLEPLPAGRRHRVARAQISVTLAVLSGSSTPKQR